MDIERTEELAGAGDDRMQFRLRVMITALIAAAHATIRAVIITLRRNCIRSSPAPASSSVRSMSMGDEPLGHLLACVLLTIVTEVHVRGPQQAQRIGDDEQRGPDICRDGAPQGR